MIKRVFDFVFALLGLVVLFPLLLLIAISIKIDSKGPVLFIQERVGQHQKTFKIYKFRTMFVKSQKKGLLTIGDNDARVTKVGFFLRKYKIDEFPQLINIIKGDMSFVGPRPELRYYVNFYKPEDLVIFKLRPGITGLASLEYRNEVELLKKAKDPEDYFINSIIPDKLRFNKLYLKKRNFLLDLKLIFITIYRVVAK
ncbi:lipopolysaccharide/colanic/teichoic acid biosynthesis glycosyltransferase [Jejuia pallidilutea]|uniref:Lipopolysaccharide/colanic/teichoic acid biosynthesis glycosyltransferase n=1 Tax=Jejuia pallidilutea TaxID=504487 RepID=A0A362WYM3_9FLAO|nr:sugar transferase [Jejuia pallidilutea]PQV47714.1 lipopolysaccharide/colanic/teichoic acid biosynthesis glycosyltransferase [Jejuia pallidilutea]